MKIIERILEILKERGIPDAQLCRAVDINIGTFSNMRRRVTDPPANKIMPICDYLCLTPEFLLTGKNPSGAKRLTKNEEQLLRSFGELSPVMQERVLGYVIGMAEASRMAEASGEKSSDSMVS